MIRVFLFVIATVLLGWQWSSRLPALRCARERLAFSLVFSLLLQLWIPFFTSKLLGFGITYGPAIALFIALQGVAVSFRWREIREKFGQARRDLHTGINLLRKNWGVAGFLLLVIACLGQLFFTHSLQQTALGLTSAGISWEDQSGHAMYTSSILYSNNLETLESPLYSGGPLAYPFLCHLLAAAYAQLGTSLGQAFWLSGWFAASALIILIYVVVRDWAGGGLRAASVITLMLFTGGFGFLDFFQGINEGTPWREMLMKHDYANAWELGLHHHNFLTAVLLPMRSFLFGMPLALSVIFLVARFLESQSEIGWREILTAGVVTGAMPLINAHSCLITAWCCTGMACIYLKIERWKTWAIPVLAYLLLVFALATPQILWTRNQINSSSPFIHLALGWMAETKSFIGWLKYWLHNGGIRIPLGFGCWLLASSRLKRITAPFLGLLVIGNLIAFQPRVYDNIKLFVFSDIAITILIVGVISNLLLHSKKIIILIFPIVFGLTASGALSILREIELQWVIVDWSGVKFAELAREKSSQRAVFLTSSELTHPLPVLTGRPLVLGYTGWLSDLGISFEKRAGDVREMFEGSTSAARLLEEYHVSFVAIGPSERREFPKLNEQFFIARATNHWQVGPYNLYELQGSTFRTDVTVAHTSK